MVCEECLRLCARPLRCVTMLGRWHHQVPREVEYVERYALMPSPAYGLKAPLLWQAEAEHGLCADSCLSVLPILPQ